MDEVVHIPGTPPAVTSTNYAALREEGMQRIRTWAKQSWTDHNVHDPGITLLEACSYAMTELGLRLQLDVGDLVRSSEARGAPDFEPSHRVLPSGPVTPQDLRSVLLDHPLVADARIFLPAENEVPFFELAGGDPPLTYAPGTARIRTGGLYEVLIELSNPDLKLNSNTYELDVVSAAVTYKLEVALPFWDDEEAAPFRPGATINTINMVLDAGNAWRELPEAQSFFGKIAVAYTDLSGTPGNIVLWVLMRIITRLDQPALVLPGILAAARTALESTLPTDTLPVFAARVRAAALAVDVLRDYLSGWRNLGEDAVRIGLVREQEIALRAVFEVTGGIDVEQLLAHVYLDVDEMLSPRVRFDSLADRREEEADPTRIYDGPLLRRGFLERDEIGTPPLAVIYTSDVMRLIMRRRSATGTDLVTQENPVGRDIVAVTDLALSNFINNRPITTDAEDCLHLVEIDRYRPRLSLAKSRIIVVRNDSEVVVQDSRVEILFEDLQAKALIGAVTPDPSAIWPIEQGDELPVEDYVPIQNELPALFGVGEAALPDNVGVARQSAVTQLQGYLFPFEQILGDLTTQLGHINRFYSGDASDTTTYFTRPPFDLPGARQLLRRFSADDIWEDFIVDPENPVLAALQSAAENGERMLDRRNRMLDHLLARQGEDAVALGQELHRWARAELAAETLPLSQQPLKIAERREAANARLLSGKSALLRDLPELNALRFLANSNPFASDETLLRIEQVGTAFRWHLSSGGTEVLRAITPVGSIAEATIAAERALGFAGRAAFYTVVPAAGQRRLQVMDGTSAAAQPLAESEETWATVADANAALPGIASSFAGLRIESSMSPLERRIAHYIGLRDAHRRRTLTATSEFFEIFTEPAGPGMFGKRWRLWEKPGNTGQVLLMSPIRFDATTDPAAQALAEESILRVLRHGVDEWNYQIVPAASPFTIELRDPAGVLLATRTPFLKREDARRMVDLAVANLYEHYGAEGIYLVEHVLLRPRNAGETFLSLPVTETQRERDPYSQRVSLVFPSGFARDFSLPLASATLTPVAPDRFADVEFRTHVESMVQRACPAHLMPKVYWVDRQLPGTPNRPGSFDTFEQRYFEWLDTLLIPGAAPATVTTARLNLVDTLNAIAHDAA